MENIDTISFLLIILIFGYIINHILAWIWHKAKYLILGDVYNKNDIGEEKDVDLFLRSIYKFVLNLPPKLNDSISGITYGSLIFIFFSQIIRYSLNNYNKIIIIHGIYINNFYFIELLKSINKFSNLINGPFKEFIFYIAFIIICSLPIFRFIYSLIHRKEKKH